MDEKLHGYEVCKECGAVGHGNMFCNTCRTYMNEKHGWNLPPWNHPAEKPCGAEEIKRFVKKLEVFRGELMICGICGKEQKSDPTIESNWRSIQLNEYQFYVCTDHFPPDGSSKEAFSDAYVKVIEVLTQKLQDALG